ncbi:MAG: TraB/GumN family protein [Pseudomonadota bacterium]
MLAFVSWSIYAAEYDCSPYAFADPAHSQPEKQIEKSTDPQGLLWSVQHESGAKSFLFGTMHLSDPRITALAAKVQPALESVSKFAMEVLFTAETESVIAARMFYSGGERLSTQLHPSLFRATKKLLQRHGVEQRAVDRVRPWAAYLTLALPPDQQGVPLDFQLMNSARQLGHTVLAIETIDEQLGVFDKLSEQTQISLLAESVCNYRQIQAQISAMVDLYFDQDLQGMIEFSDGVRTPVNAVLVKRMFTDRNKVMVDRIKPWMEQGDIFVAVGALHLPGETGLLKALERLGFKVQAVAIGANP